MSFARLRMKGRSNPFRNAEAGHYIPKLKGPLEGRFVMGKDRSFHEARWLLGPIFGLCVGFVSIGLVLN